ncbi:hypothetical protein M2432_001786 [Mycobacterium sp. OTB74]|nr:hypothetical protein [Mycobacterium sp. OTB74]
MPECFTQGTPLLVTETRAGSRRSLTDSVVAVFGVVLGVHLAIALAVGAESWDDGYITLSFARTFAETGHFALTPMRTSSAR